MHRVNSMYGYNVHGLRIKSSVKLPIPSHFFMPETDVPVSGRYDLQVEIGNNDIIGMDPVSQPYLFFKKNSLLHNYRMLLPCNLLIKHLEGDTKIRVSWLYDKIPQFNSDQIIDYILDLKFIQKGFLKLHGASVEYSGDGIMIAGWDGCGKSTISLRFIERGASFLSDDTTIVDKDFAYSYPKRIKAFRGADGIKQYLKNVPVVNKFLGIYEKTYPKNIADKTKIKYIFIPVYGEKSIEKLTKKDALETMLTLNTYRTKTRDTRNLVLAYCYYNKYDLDSLMNSRKEILKSFLKHAECYEIKSKNVQETLELIDSVLNK